MPKLKREATFHDRQHGILTTELYAWLFARDDMKRQQMVDYFRQRWDDEDKLQVATINTLYAIMKPDFEATHIPGGGAHVGKRAGAYLKYLGCKPGVSDLLCLWRGGDGFIEIKANASLSGSQKEFGAYLDLIGKPRVVVRTIAHAVQALHSWGAPIEERFHPLAKLHTA